MVIVPLRPALPLKLRALGSVFPFSSALAFRAYEPGCRVPLAPPDPLVTFRSVPEGPCRFTCGNETVALALLESVTVPVAVYWHALVTLNEIPESALTLALPTLLDASVTEPLTEPESSTWIVAPCRPALPEAVIVP
jgi:hypothetical protein